MPEKPAKTLVSSTLAVTLIILVSKAAGFVREMIMAYVFGANAETDAYNSAYSLFYLPVLLFSSCISSTLVPQYLHCREELGEAQANRFSSNTLTLFSIASLVVSAIMFIAARPLVRTVYPGFAGEKLELTVLLTRVMLPALMFFAAGLVLSSILNAREKYVAAQLTGLPLSAAEIAAALFFSEKYGINAQAWGVIAAGILQILILMPYLKGSFRYRPGIDLSDKYLRRLMVLAVPAVLSMAVNELNHMVDRMLASGLNDGDISAMTYAFKLIMFMMGVLVVPLTTVSFSRMAKETIKSGSDAVAAQVRESMRLLITVIVPIVIVAAVESRHIIRFAYGRGSFTQENVQVTGLVFLYYVIGVPFFALRDLTNRVYHAFQDTRTPMLVAAVSVVINITLNLILRRIMGVYGLALATGIAAFVGVTLLFALLSRKTAGIFDKSFVFTVSRILAANIPVFICAYALDMIWPESFGTGLVFIRLAAVTLCSLTVYILSLIALGGRQTIKILTQLIKRFKR